MRHVYEVKYEIKATGVGDWLPEEVNVLGNGDASGVVEKVRRKALKDRWDGEGGKVHRVTGFRLLSVHSVAHVDM